MDDLFYDFKVDKEAKTIYITREFDADLDLVWDAFTKAEILDQWNAPAPFTARTKYMNFKVGGSRFYAMISPEGQEKWSLQTYISITPKSNFKQFNVFTDPEGNPEPTGSDWDYKFIEHKDMTRVMITIHNESFERMERLLEGFTIGMKMSLENLDTVLMNLSAK